MPIPTTQIRALAQEFEQRALHTAEARYRNEAQCLTPEERTVLKVQLSAIRSRRLRDLASLPGSPDSRVRHAQREVSDIEVHLLALSEGTFPA